MVKKYIIDSCIWRDFYEDRVSKSGRPLGKYAYDLFVKILKRNDIVLFSEALVRELRKKYSEEEINEMLNLVRHIGTLIRIEITDEEDAESRELSVKRSLPRFDCLNAVHSRNHNALLVSQDKHIIYGLSDVAKSLRPEEID
ncbi:MAG TPA: PIN domain-containing protein [Candidatus Nanoarchaeia archaeon]|nr:PIN domain-containing protein [Candidatus Nanoarchaeia archaeon]